MRGGSGPERARVAAALAAILACHAALALTSLRRNSVTMDEFAHLPAGLSYWQRGTFALYHHNPPLVKMLAALPVLASHPVVDYGGSWARAREGGYQPSHVDFAREFMRANASRYFDLFDRARAVIVAISLLGGLLLFLWGREIWGAGGGLLAAAIWAFDPNVLAHAGVVTTDVGAAVALFASVYMFRRWLIRRTWGRAAAAGAVLGIALLVKFSALVLFLVLPVLGAGWWALARRGGAGAAGHDAAGGDAGRRGAASRPAALAGQALLVPLLGLLVLNAGYGFEGTGRLLGGFDFLSPALTVPRTGGTPPYHPSPFYRMLYAQRENRFAHGALASLPTPLPEQFVLGLDDQWFESGIGLSGGGYAVYLNGTVRRHGWWNYYLYALLYKVPIGTWLLAAAALAAAVWPGAAGAGLRVGAGRDLRLAPAEEMLWLAPTLAVLAGTSLMTGLDLGVRYLLPMFPFVYLGCGRLARLAGERGRRTWLLAPVAAAALVWNAGTCVAAWPHYLSYFNEAAGGPAGGARHLLDSNLDWGQDLLALRRWIDRHPEPEAPALAYFGAVDPGVAGIRYRLPPRDPRVVRADRLLPDEADALRPGTYAVSVNFVFGLPYRMVDEEGHAVPVDRDALGYFRLLRPAARAGDSIWIYRLDAEDVARVRRAWGRALATAPGG